MPTKHRERTDSAGHADGRCTTSRLFVLGGMALIFAAICVAYYPALQGRFLWDDDAHVTKPELRSLHGLGRIWFDVGATQQYYPLLHSAFWIEHQMWGDQPLGYHLVNLLQHAAAACLVFLLLRKLGIPGALLAAALFALHPVQVESVAWITEQKNTLSAVFYLSAMLVYLHFDQSRKPSLYAVALTLFILGLLSKTVTATLPAALLVIFWWQRGSLSWKRDVRPLIPFFVLGAVAGLFTAWMERTQIGAEGAPFELSIVQRGLLAGRVIWFYLGKLLWPTNLIFIYPRWQVDPHVWWQWLYPLAALAMLAVLWLVRRRWRGPLASWLFFVGTLFPVLGFFNVYPFLFSFVADHFQYLASLGVLVLAAAGLALASSRLPPSAQWIGKGLCMALVAVLATITWRQAEMYSDAMALYQTTIDKNPNCWMAYINLGNELSEMGKVQEAKERFRQAVELKPDDAMAHNNLGNALAKEGRYAEAVEQFQLALELRPDYPQIHYNFGNSLKRMGRVQEAIEQYQRALKLKPDYAEACNNLGNALIQSGRIPEAIEYYQQALRLNPDFPEIHNNLGSALQNVGRLQEAIGYFRQALQLKPDLPEVHNNLGSALSKAGQLQEAIVHYQQALKLQPDYIQACTNLAAAYAQLRQPAEAQAAAQKALELARSQGQTELAKQLESWLNSYRASQSEQPDKAAPLESAPAGP